MNNKTLIFFITIFLPLLPSGFLGAYDVPLPEDEAPTALFSLGMEDEDVELYIKGTWDASFTASWGF